MNKEMMEKIIKASKSKEVEVEIKPYVMPKPAILQPPLLKEEQVKKIKRVVTPQNNEYTVFLLEGEQVRREKISAMILSRYPKANIYHARTYADSKEIFKIVKHFDLLLLDYDLADKYGDGRDVARHIVEKKITYSRAIIHSLNYGGAEKIRDTLTFRKTSVIAYPILEARYFEEMPKEYLYK